MAYSVSEVLGRFGHHPDPAIDFCVEVEELEAITESARLGLSGFGHEQDRTSLNGRIERAMEFRVGGDANAVAAKGALRALATARGFNLRSVASYAGQPVARIEVGEQA